MNDPITPLQTFRATQWLNDHWDTLLPIDFDDCPVGVKLYTRSPYMASESTLYPDINSLADIDVIGWCPAETVPVPQFEGTPTPLVGRIVDDSLQVGTVSAGVFTAGFVDPTGGAGNSSGWLCTPSGNTNPNRYQELVSAIVFYLQGTIDGTSNPILFIYRIDQMEDVVLHDDMLIGATGLGTFLALRSGGTEPVSSGNIYIEGLVPPWESAGAIHAWVQPQRINFIANPNFQNSGVEQSAPFWRARAINAAEFTPTADAFQQFDGSGNLVGHMSMVNGNTLIVESNLFPTQTKLWCSIRFAVNSEVAGKLRLGLLCWNQMYDESVYVCTSPAGFSGHDDVQLTPNAGGVDGIYTIVQLLTRIAPGTQEAQLRLEFMPDEPVDDTTLFLKEVLVDLNESQFDYFDGATTYGAAMDHQWHGEEAHAHFSMWYNNFANTEARLFGGFDEGLGAYQLGLAEEWVAKGVDVYSHWHSIAAHQPLGWAGNYYYPLVDVSGTLPTVEPSSFMSPTLRPLPDAISSSSRLTGDGDLRVI